MIKIDWVARSLKDSRQHIASLYSQSLYPSPRNHILNPIPNSKRIRLTILDTIPLHALADHISKQHILFIFAVYVIDQSQHSVGASRHT
jgi:hypothetical protein